MKKIIGWIKSKLFKETDDRVRWLQIKNPYNSLVPYKKFIKMKPYEGEKGKLFRAHLNSKKK